MHNRLPWLLLIAFVAAACTTTSSKPRADLLQPEIKLVQKALPMDTFFFRGLVPLDYELIITNKSGEPITLKRLNLRTVGLGGYSLNTGSTPIVKLVPPQATVRVPITTWGTTRGGFFSATEPVTIRGTAVFDSPEGAFQTVFTENLFPGAGPQ